MFRHFYLSEPIRSPMGIFISISIATGKRCEGNSVFVFQGNNMYLNMVNNNVRGFKGSVEFLLPYCSSSAERPKALKKI